MFLIRVFLTTGCAGILAGAAYAQTATLRVSALDSLSGDPLIGVTLQSETAGKGAVSGPNGYAEIHDLPAGPHTIRANSIGYQGKTLSVRLPQPPGDTLIIRLAPESADIQEVVVESTRSNSRVEDSPTKVEVLGQEDMDEENGIKPGNVASILGDYSGIQIQQTSLASANSAVRIQGLAGRYTQVLRDGLPVYGGLAGDFGILQVQPLDLRQIELIRGPASTLFGGGAIAGIVNFISKQPGRKPECALTLNQTTLGESNANWWLSGRKGSWGGTLFAGAIRQNARDVDGDGFSDVPRLRSITAHPRLFYYGADKSQLAIGATLTAEKRNGGDLEALRHGPGPVHAYFETNRLHRGILDAHYRHPDKQGGEWNAKAAFGWFQRQRDEAGWNFDGRQQDWFSELSYQKTAGRWHWVTGLNYNGNAFEKTRTDSLHFNNFQYQTAGAFTQLAFHRENRLDAEAGLRIDRHSNYGWFALPAAAVLYHLTPALAVRAGFGLGYATPNPLTAAAETEEVDLRHILAPPDTLRPERSAGGNLEWSFRKLLGESLGLFVNQQFFYTGVDRPFLTEPDSSGLLYWSNANKPVTTYGVDTYFRLDWNIVELYLGYTYALARKTYDTAQPYVPLTPQHRAAGVFALPLGKHFRTGVEASWTGAQRRYDGSRTPAYFFVAGMLGVHFGHIDLVLNGENLLDFRQTRKEAVVLPPLKAPIFVPLWAPVDGRVINLSATWRL